MVLKQLPLPLVLFNALLLRLTDTLLPLDEYTIEDKQQEEDDAEDEDDDDNDDETDDEDSKDKDTELKQDDDKIVAAILSHFIHRFPIPFFLFHYHILHLVIVLD